MLVLGAFGRLISRRPSQQHLRSIKSDKSLKSKLPRSRSDRTLTNKKRVFSSDSENTKSSEEDGYSMQEISGLKGDIIDLSQCFCLYRF